MPNIALNKFKPANNLDADLTDLYEIQLFIWVRSTTNCVNSASPFTPSSSYSTLTYIDRAEFSDVNVALSFGGSAGQVAKVLGAVFGVYLLKIQYTQVLDMPVLTTTPDSGFSKMKGGLPQALRLSKIVCKG